MSDHGRECWGHYMRGYQAGLKQAALSAERKERDRVDGERYDAYYHQLAVNECALHASRNKSWWSRLLGGICFLT